MNNRDPFSLRRSPTLPLSFLRGGASLESLVADDLAFGIEEHSESQIDDFDEQRSHRASPLAGMSTSRRQSHAPTKIQPQEAESWSTSEGSRASLSASNATRRQSVGLILKTDLQESWTASQSPIDALNVPRRVSHVHALKNQSQEAPPASGSEQSSTLKPPPRKQSHGYAARGEGQDTSRSANTNRHDRPHPLRAFSFGNIAQKDEPGPLEQTVKTASRYAEGVGERLQEIFTNTNEELPLFKDKPYNYTPSEIVPLWRRQRLILMLVAIVALILYLSSVLIYGLPYLPSVPHEITRLGSNAPNWDVRRDRVKRAFKLSWKAYEDNAWGYDEYHPVTKTGRQMVPNGMGWIIVDALDTMILMNLTSELTHAREWVSTTLNYDKDHDVNTFETTIRMLGGLLSAHYLSTSFPDMAPLNRTGPADDDLYLEKASDLADRLMGAYESASGVPFASINLSTRKGIPSHDDGGASSTAEAATLQLEMKYLSKLTGETAYWEVAEKVIKVIDDNGMPDGLLPIFIHANHGTFQGSNIRLGSRGDSYYEYLIKQYLQTSEQEPIYYELWDQALAGVRKHLITYTKHANLTVLAERPAGLGNPLLPKMDHLVCFMPGTIALGATGGMKLDEARQSPFWGQKQEDEMELAQQLMKTCWGMYKVTATGLSPEIAHFHVDKPAPMMADAILSSPDELSGDPQADWRKDYDIHTMDYHNLQRPETVESLFYMWRITGDIKYREWGWRMFQSFMKHTFVNEESGFSSIGDVAKVPPPFRDNMESFWLAETLKYFYLLFGPDDILPLDQIVLNTEAHPFPRFELGKLFKTGWTRKPRDESGNIIVQAEPTVMDENEPAAVQTTHEEYR